jgi:hypothetical protein
VKATVKPDGTITVDTDGRPAVKAWDGETVAGALVKADDERRYTLTVAYPADKADAAVAADGHRDFASKDAVRQAAWSFLVKSPMVGLHHAEGTDGAGTVVESFTWPGPDWSPDGAGYTVKEGDWLVGVVWSEQAWSLIKSGKVGGVSMQGSAKRRKPAPEALAGLRS